MPANRDQKLNLLRSVDWVVNPSGEVAIASGDKTAAETALRAAQPELARGVRAGVMPKNTASRKMSRLAARVKGIA